MQVAPKPISYRVCTSPDTEKLTTEVTALLAQGWQPHGDLHVVQKGETVTYLQAVVKVVMKPVELPPEVQAHIQQQQQGGQIVVPRGPTIQQ
jgi:hypothetical protein